MLRLSKVPPQLGFDLSYALTSVMDYIPLIYTMSSFLFLSFVMNNKKIQYYPLFLTILSLVYLVLP